MAEPARLDTILAQNEQELLETERTPIWQRLEAEPALWYRRFKLFRQLGPKRTLLAALLKEQSTAKVLKGTEGQQKSATVAKKRSKAVTSGHLAEVPKSQPTQVPGSWKRASIKYRWIERASAYDDYRIEKAVEQNLEQFLSGPAVLIERVQHLKTMYDVMRASYNEQQSKMTYEQENAWIARMQSILRDIREEMAHYDETIARLALRLQITKKYHEWTPPEPDEMAKQLVKELGSHAKALEALEQFERQQARKVGAQVSTS